MHIGLNTQFAGVYVDRGISYAAKRGHLDRALADYDKAIELNPRYALAFNNRAKIYLGKKGSRPGSCRLR